MKRLTLAIAIVLVSVTVVLGSTPSYATFPGRNGRIAFAHDSPLDRNGDCCGEIYTVNPDGSGFHTLTWGPAFKAFPSFSADGKRIVFALSPDWYHAWHIAVIDAGGGHLHRLTDGQTIDTDPVFRPDGRKIAFTRNGAIYTMNADGTGAHLLVENARKPNYSPDGRLIAFEGRFGDNVGLFVMNTDGSHRRQLTKTPYSGRDEADQPIPLYFDNRPRFSPDGKWIVFMRRGGGQGTSFDAGGDICVIDTRGQRFRDLTPSFRFKYANNYKDPTFSPDGRLIAFGDTSSGPDLSPGVLEMRRDGTHRRFISRGHDLALDWQPLPATTSRTRGPGR